MNFYSASVSPDGALLAIYIVGYRPGLGPTLGVWSDSTQKHMEGVNSTVERYSHGTWIYDLEQSSFIARIDDYYHATWTKDSTLELFLTVPDGPMTETITWDAESRQTIGSPIVESHTPNNDLPLSKRFQVAAWKPTKDLTFHDRDLDVEVNLGPALAYVRRADFGSALYYVTVDGDLKRYRAERNQPGRVALVASDVASGPCFLEVAFYESEARVTPKVEGPGRVRASEVNFIDLETGKVESGPGGAYSAHSWSIVSSRSMRPGRRFESLSGPHKGALFFQAEQGLVKLSSHDDYIVPLPKEKGFLLIPDRFAEPEVQLIHLDENGEPVAVIGSFLRN